MERLIPSRSKFAISLVDQKTYVMSQEDKKREMEMLRKMEQ